jgi:uncharacterized protein (DUF1501 family)
MERRRRDAVAALKRLASSNRSYSGDFPLTKLGRQLASVAWLIGERIGARVYYLEQPGYDTHSSQAQTHAELLRDLGSSLAAFHRRNQQLGTSRHVTVMVFSEFGRRAAENESEGTDHGAAGPVLLLGGAIRGGVHGKKPDLERLDQGDVAVSTDFRSIYSSLLLNVLGVPPSVVLPGGAPLLPLFAS